MQQAVDRLKSRVGELADLDFNMQVFDGEGATGDDIAIACNTLPFASDLRLVIVRNVDKLSKESADLLVGYAQDPAPTCVLALTGAKLAKNTRLYKAVARLGGVVERKMPRGAEFVRSVSSMASDKGKRLSLDAAEVFVSATGEDLRRVAAELDKLIAFVGDREEITRQDVESVVATTSTAKVWELADALGGRDCRRSLVLTNDLLGDGESVFALHAVALRAIRDLLSVRALLDRGVRSAHEIAEVMGRPEWQVRRLPRQASAFTSQELVALLIDAAESERKMKTSPDSRLVFERWLVKVCGV